MKLRLLVLAGFLLTNFPGICQTNGAVLTGVVRDPSGAVVANAMVSLRYPDLGLRKMLIADAVGAYRFDGLPVGLAEVEIEKPGFRVLHSATVLSPGEVKTLHFSLRALTDSEAPSPASSARDGLLRARYPSGGARPYPLARGSASDCSHETNPVRRPRG